MKRFLIAFFSLGALTFFAQWVAGRVAVLSVDLDTAPLGRYVRLEQDPDCFSVYYGDSRRPRGDEPGSASPITATRGTLIVLDVQSFRFGPLPDDGSPPRWFVLRFPNWYAVLVFGLGLLGTIVRGRLLHPQAELRSAWPPTGWRVRLCDAAILVGIVLVTAALFWAGSVVRLFSSGPGGVLFAVGLLLGGVGVLGYRVIGRRVSPTR